jgi:hypothetical protein
LVGIETNDENESEKIKTAGIVLLCIDILVAFTFIIIHCNSL